MINKTAVLIACHLDDDLHIRMVDNRLACGIKHLLQFVSASRIDQ